MYEKSDGHTHERRQNFIPPTLSGITKLILRKNDQIGQTADLLDSNLSMRGFRTFC